MSLCKYIHNENSSSHPKQGVNGFESEHAVLLSEAAAKHFALYVVTVQGKISCLSLWKIF